MPTQAPKSAQSYQSDILSSLMQTGITQTAPGGKARAFCDIVGAKVGESEANCFVTIAQNLLPYATGPALDFLGTIFNVERIGPQDNSSPLTDDNFQFYVLRGTFGNINNGQDIVVPQNTRIYTASGNNGPVMLTTADVTLPASASQASVSVIAFSSGSAGNAPAGVFTQHNFAAYTDNAYGSLLVTNNYGLAEGRDAEDDTSYRYRINLKLSSPAGNAEANIRLAVLAVPGVQDCSFTPLAGTFTAYIYGIAPQVPPSLLSTVQAAVDGSTAYPLAGTAVTPDLVGISFSTSLVLVKGASAADQQAAVSAAVSAGSDYINNLSVGQEFVINELASVILNSNSNIVDIGQPNQPLSSIFIWRSRSDGTRFSRYLVADYTPAVGERLLVETSIANPVSIGIAS